MKKVLCNYHCENEGFEIVIQRWSKNNLYVEKLCEYHAAKYFNIDNFNERVKRSNVLLNKK